MSLSARRWYSDTRCHWRACRSAKTKAARSAGHWSRMSAIGSPPFCGSASWTSTSGLSPAMAARASRRQLRECMYPFERKMRTAADSSMYVSRRPMSARSSTSRKTRTPGRQSCSCRLITATWSWPVIQTWLKKRWYVMPRARRSSGSAPVARRRRTEAMSLERCTSSRRLKATKPTMVTSEKTSTKRKMASAEPPKPKCSHASAATWHVLTSSTPRKMRVSARFATTASRLSTGCLNGLSAHCPAVQHSDTSSAASVRSSPCSSLMSSTKPVSVSLRSSSTGSHQKSANR
mmetsp:Transcript_17622/g.40387  ORF Transcript_17622/g.40387 Transcript_17622/m.40387 type:complete len:291 (-) Transcript_17622:93-965(-)